MKINFCFHFFARRSEFFVSFSEWKYILYYVRSNCMYLIQSLFKYAVIFLFVGRIYIQTFILHWQKHRLEIWHPSRSVCKRSIQSAFFLTTSLFSVQFGFAMIYVFRCSDVLVDSFCSDRYVCRKVLLVCSFLFL